MTNVLISGASVAGPALAYWLNRQGMRVTIVEKAHAVRPGGLAVDFRGSAMWILEQMGILDELRRHATGSGDATIVAEDGTPIATMPGEIFSGDLEVHKADLTRILYELTSADTEYVFGDSIRAISQLDHGVRVNFERGEPRTFDLVIGADGLHSRVRALAFGPDERFAHSLGYWFASFSLENYLNLAREGLTHVCGHRSANIFAGRVGSEARALFMFAAPPEEPPRGDVAAQQRAIAEAYAGVGWEVPRLLDAMAESADFYFDTLSQIRMDTWSTGRVALVGDAGYCASPMSGRGTSQALIGAYVLAGELATAPDRATAFASYERILRDYVEANHELGRQATASLEVPPTQEMIDAMTEAPPEGGPSNDDVPLPDYRTHLTVL
ncbi:MAG TPA: FAD-dependent monooxygenase [Actinophytocola sp.]|jgi:2-polyprenyl-6-methoxyphenol hydroxylase-like FAD-dependent oxidoreductase|nr:FAD-dependent monooxygenase [Actinophytocola sp.]